MKLQDYGKWIKVNVTKGDWWAHRRQFWYRDLAQFTSNDSLRESLLSSGYINYMVDIYICGQVACYIGLYSLYDDACISCETSEYTMKNTDKTYYRVGNANYKHTEMPNPLNYYGPTIMVKYCNGYAIQAWQLVDGRWAQFFPHYVLVGRLQFWLASDKD